MKKRCPRCRFRNARDVSACARCGALRAAGSTPREEREGERWVGLPVMGNGDLAVAQSILANEGVAFFVANATGVRVPAQLMIRARDLPDVRRLLANFQTGWLGKSRGPLF